MTLCRICLSIEVKLGLGVQGLTTSLDKLQATGQIFESKSDEQFSGMRNYSYRELPITLEKYS